jgi:nucleoside-triphosphatase
MTSTQPVILLTGRPGIGKTTVIKKIVSLLENNALANNVGGFYTREVRVRGKRTGFEIVTLAGQVDYLATKEPDIVFAAEVPFGKYRVNLTAIDEIAIPALLRAVEQDQLVIIDEIGPMEIRSKRFCQTVLEILAGETVVLGTIVQKPDQFADKVKAHPRVMVKEITLANRAQIPKQVYAELVRYSTGS